MPRASAMTWNVRLLLMFLGCSSYLTSVTHSQVINASTNILTRYEGECRVFLDCPINGQVSPTWVIDGTLYSVSSLQVTPLFQPGYNSLIITAVNKTINMVSFQCIIPDPTPGRGLRAIGGQITTLIVEEGVSTSSLCETNSPLDIILDAQEIFFSSDNVTWAWKVNMGDNYPLCPPVMFEVNVLNCSGAKQLYSVVTNKKNISIPYTDVVHEVNSEKQIHYTTIDEECSMNANCRCSEHYFAGLEVESENVRTKTVNVGLQRDACIEIPQASPERGTLHVLWPCSLTDRNLPDCDCSVYLAGNFRLQQCQYYNSSIYTLEIQTEELGKHKLCFKNMTSSMNNTHVHFFRETSECSPRELGFGTSRRTTFQRFISSYLIVLREVPLPPDVTINNTTLICYNSAKSMNAQSLFFEIVIYDVTSEIVFEEQSQNSTYCADVNDLLNDNLCSPYTVTVRAYNLYISSNTTIMFSNGTGLNVCGCVAQNRVNVTLQSVKEEATRIIFNVSCNNKFVLPTNITVQIESVSKFMNDNHTISCLSGLTFTKVIFDGLPRKTEFSSKIVWSMNENCQLIRQHTFYTKALNIAEIIVIVVLTVVTGGPTVCYIVQCPLVGIARSCKRKKKDHKLHKEI